MSNLFKSKFFLGVMIVAVLLVGVVSVNTAAAATTTVSTITHTLKVGSPYNAEVKILQAGLGLTADGSFGPKTKAAVEAWQTKEGLTADGVFGPKSLAAFGGGMVSTLPAGCSSTSGYSATTGAMCSTGVVTPVTTLPAGCVTTSGFSSTTGASCATGVVVSQSGPITVSLSQDNPAAGYVIANQATADLAHFTLTGTGVVNSITLMRTGISDQNTLANVYLYNGATRLTDGYSFNNSSVLTMNNLGLTVNGSLEIAVKADISSTAGTSASTVGVTLTGLTAGTTASTVNVAGNMMYVGVGTPATVYINPSNQTVTNASVNAGTSSYTVWSNPIQVNTRSVLLKGANFRMIGSAPVGALANINLFVDGVQAGTSATVGTINGSNYAMFDFSANPLTLTTGSHTVDVRADIVSGSSYTVQVSLQQAADLVLTDPQLNINIAPSINGTSAFTSSSAGTITINAGSASVVVDPAFSALTNITGGSTNAVIARFKVHGYGENVKVQSLSVTPVFTAPVTATATSNAIGTVATVTLAGAGYMKTPAVTATGGTCTTEPTATATVSSGTITAVTLTGGVCTVAPTLTIASAASTQNGLNNLAVFFNGSQVGSSQTWTSGAATFNLGSQMIIPAATDSMIEVHADLQDNSSVNYTNGTVAATLNVGSSNGQGQTSHTTLNFPGGSVAGTSLAIQNGLLAVSQNASYSNQSANPNTAGVKIGSFTLQNQSSSEGVRVTSLVIGLAGNEALTNLSNLRTSETSGSGATPVQPTASNTFSVNFTLAPSATKTIDILGDTSTASGVTVITSLGVTAIGATSNVSIAQNGTGVAVTGQTITLQAGTITNPPTLLTASATSSQYIAAANGAANATKATFNFAATNGNATITELKFTANGANSVSSVSVGSISAPVVGGVAYLTGLNLVVPNGSGGLNQDVYVSYPVIGTNGLSSGTTSTLSLTYVKYSSGGTTATFSPNVAAPQMTLVGSVPTFTAVQPSTHLSAGGLVEAIDVTVAANTAGNIALATLPVSVSGSGGSIVLGAATGIVVKDANNTTVTTSTTGYSAGTGGAASIVFTGGYTVQAGQSQTFKIFVPVTGYTPAGVNSVSLSTSLPTTGVAWTDLAGNGGAGALGATLIPSYPSTFNSVIYN